MTCRARIMGAVITLFVTCHSGGNTPPLLGVAQRVVADGGRALVLGTPGQRSAVEAAGLPFEPFGAEQAWRALEPVTLLQNLRQVSGTLLDRGIAADAVRVARRESAAVVVVDCMLLRAIDECVRAGLPTVSLVHSLPSYFAGGLARGPVGAVATARGLRPARVWGSAAGTIATVLPGFGDDADGPFPALRRVGPVTPSGPVPAPVAREAREAGRPRILVSLSTIWFPGQEATLQKLLDAIGGLDLDAVVTTGPSIDPAGLRAPGNAELHRFLDHDAVLPGVDLVVGHGGHGTTMRALAHGVPLLVVPSFAFADQPAVGRAVARAGAGATLPPRTGVADLRRAIAELAAPGPHRQAAAELGARIRALDPAGAATSYLAALAPA